MSDEALRHAYGLGPRIERPATAATPLWVATEQAMREFQAMTIAFSNQEASESQLLDSARRLRGLQHQWI